MNEPPLKTLCTAFRYAIFILLLCCLSSLKQHPSSVSFGYRWVNTITCQPLRRLRVSATFNWNSIFKAYFHVYIHCVLLIFPFFRCLWSLLLSVGIENRIFRAHNPNSRCARGWCGRRNFYQPRFNHQYNLYRAEPTWEVFDVLDAQQWGRVCYTLWLDRGGDLDLSLKTFCFKAKVFLFVVVAGGWATEKIERWTFDTNLLQHKLNA